MAGRARRWLVALAALPAAAILLLALAAGAGALSNRGLPTRSALADRLAPAEKARIAEAAHLRASMGDAVWPGWGSADLPIIVYNESHAFLIGISDPAPGWTAPDGNHPRGGEWEAVPGDSFDGRRYYRQRLRGGATPQSFTVKVGGRWVASLQTLEWFEISLRRQIHRDLPRLVRDIVPYRLVTKLFIGGSDGYISLALHESFHAFQGSVTPDRLLAAERSTVLERPYEKAAAGMREAWRPELTTLTDSLRATSKEQARSLAAQFLRQREQRRSRQRLSAALIDYEQQREWLEGLGKYVELEVWRRAAKAPDYQPLAVMSGDGKFDRYRGFDAKWSRELGQITRSASDEGRFYYSGMAQAALLDRLQPGWKATAFDERASLEELLGEALRK